MPIAILNRANFNGTVAGSVTAEAATAAAAGHDATVHVRATAGIATATASANDATARTGTSLRTITHGNQLLTSDVGPWALQGVSKGSETLQSPSGPGRGFWRFDTPNEFSSASAWPSNANDDNPEILNDPALISGTVTGSPVTIDGYSIPVGTRIVQWQNWPNGYDFNAQGTSLKVLFRGCRFRWASGVGGPSIFNDVGGTSSQRIMLHFCDIGFPSSDLAANSGGLMHIKWLGGRDHRMLRTYHTITSTHVQPNAQGCEITECIMEHRIFPYGESGESGGFDNSVLHLNGISCEGGISDIKILRNKIVCESPDVTTGTTGGTSAGDVGYGLLSGQTGYGSGTEPGRLTPQTDCIALFTTNGQPNQGTIEIKDNLVGGSGICIYAGSNDGQAQGVVLTGNRVTTRWWTNGGSFGPIDDQPTWGSNGNVQSDNLWADDYGTGGNGCTAPASRQYPAGNGPRAGASFI